MTQEEECVQIWGSETVGPRASAQPSAAHQRRISAATDLRGLTAEAQSGLSGRPGDHAAETQLSFLHHDLKETDSHDRAILFPMVAAATKQSDIAKTFSKESAAPLLGRPGPRSAGSPYRGHSCPPGLPALSHPASRG